MEISLTACRANARMTRAELATVLEVSPATIYNWERGKSEPTLSQLRRISDISGVPIDNIAVGIDSSILSTDS